MARGRTTQLLCAAVSFSFFIIAIVLNGTTPRYITVRRIHTLEQRVAKLREALRLREEMEGGDNRSTSRTADDARSSQDVNAADPQPRISRCEVIHVAMVAGGYNASRSVVTVVKSILFYRRNPLHFHLVADRPASTTLAEVFRTWRLPAVQVSFYPLEEAANMVSWIPNFHYSGTYGLIKLVLTDVLPVHVDRTIVLDTDVTVCADLADLWRLFGLLQKDGAKLIGLVENQSNWYLGKLWEGHKPWPAVGRGVNSGVMLLHLEAMRKARWRNTWTDVTRKVLPTYRATALADQDVINAVVKETPDILYLLPCTWNVQLSEHTLSDYCLHDAEEYKLVHWNSPMKQHVRNKHAPYFGNLFLSFQSYDGNLLKTILTNCQLDATEGPSSSPPPPSASLTAARDPCLDVRREQEVVFRTHPFFLHYDYRPTSPFDVTLVAQFSLDRLHMLDPLCEHWSGPLSLAMYATDAEAHDFLRFLDNRLPALSGRWNVGLHVVYKDPRSAMYPVNHLRNVALKYANTPYVYLSDIDFLPMHGMYRHLTEALQALAPTPTEKLALVVPAFETGQYRFDFPENKTRLLSAVREARIRVFRADVWSRGHGATDFERWSRSDLPYSVSWHEDYEPYVVVASNVTRYDTRFVGFGWNKVSHVMALHSEGYQFIVLPSAFMVHMPHAPSLEIASFRRNKHYRDCLKVLKKEFVNELENKIDKKIA